MTGYAWLWKNTNEKQISMVDKLNFCNKSFLLKQTMFKLFDTLLIGSVLIRVYALMVYGYSILFCLRYKHILLSLRQSLVWRHIPFKTWEPTPISAIFCSFVQMPVPGIQTSFRFFLFTVTKQSSGMCGFKLLAFNQLPNGQLGHSAQPFYTHINMWFIFKPVWSQCARWKIKKKIAQTKWFWGSRLGTLGE